MHHRGSDVIADECIEFCVICESVECATFTVASKLVRCRCRWMYFRRYMLWYHQMRHFFHGTSNSFHVVRCRCRCMQRRHGFCEAIECATFSCRCIAIAAIEWITVSSICETVDCAAIFTWFHRMGVMSIRSCTVSENALRNCQCFGQFLRCCGRIGHGNGYCDVRKLERHCLWSAMHWFKYVVTACTTIADFGKRLSATAFSMR